MHSSRFCILTILLARAIAQALALSSANVSAGIINGVACSSAVTSFLGVPYAQAPIGGLRFAPPKPYAGAFPGGALNASASAPICIQFGFAFGGTEPASEDCLYLNVWAPTNATSTSGLPVKVWIYGGFETSGGISLSLYNGCNLAAQNSVVVSIAYRLGPLGFLALSSAGIGGNFAIQDILLGLQWVQSNIVQFGGDPTKVLLFGQSAGAVNVFQVAALPQAPSLIKAAIMESGGGGDALTNATIQSLGLTYANWIGCDVTNITCFRSKQVAELNSSYIGGGDLGVYNGRTFTTYVDGKVIPAQASKVGVQVPSVFGSNAEDGTLFVLEQFRSPTAPTAADYNQFLLANFGTAAMVVNQTFPLSLFDSTPFPPFFAIEAVITDVTYLCRAYRGLQVSAQKGIPVWTYQFNHTPSCPWVTDFPAAALPALGSTHTAEIPFVFGNLIDQPTPNGTCKFTSAEDLMSASLISAWTSMAEYGEPTNNGTFQWPAFNASQSLGLKINNSTSTGVIDYSACRFWDEINDLVFNGTIIFNGTASGTSTATASPTAGSPTGTASPSASVASTGAGGLGSTLIRLLSIAALVLAFHCIHIFCVPCSEQLGLANPGGGQRQCPACSSALTNPDDAVSTLLSPTEDYKTSVLSGMSPTTIMECAGRGLAFWSYQSTQEIIYQEYLAKSLTDKFGNVNAQMDKIIHDANAEIDSLTQKITQLHMEQDKLKTEHTKLTIAFRDKSRQHQQTQELYDRLKRKEMTAATQSAAFDSVDEVLQSVSSRQNPEGLANHNPFHAGISPSRQYQHGNDIQERFQAPYEHNGDENTTTGRMMPPPLHHTGPPFGSESFRQQNTVSTTPFGHRTRLGSTFLPSRQHGAGSVGVATTDAPATSHAQTPSQRRPLINVNSTTVSRPSVSGYGMSAGLKIGRQQAGGYRQNTYTRGAEYQPGGNMFGNVPHGYGNTGGIH
ncbi:hypothetical protein MMC11_002907 [Xylographa trunciseda]|nr:hypothetical protein [Xylographa trunciseda]